MTQEELLSKHPDFQSTRKGIWSEPGFYALLYEDGRQEHVYCYVPEQHGDYAQSFFVVSPNTRDEVGHDFGIYRWVSQFPMGLDRYSEPVAWRVQDAEEERALRQNLYQFDRKRKPMN